MELRILWAQAGSMWRMEDFEELQCGVNPLATGRLYVQGLTEGVRVLVGGQGIFGHSFPCWEGHEKIITWLRLLICSGTMFWAHNVQNSIGCSQLTLLAPMLLNTYHGFGFRQRSLALVTSLFPPSVMIVYKANI